MKTRRFFSLFLSLLVILLLTAPALAADGDTGSVAEGEIRAKAALLIDPDTEEILYARNIHERLYPASLTKIMTCLLVLEAIDDGALTRDKVLTASEAAVNAVPADGSNVGIKPGEELTVEELLYCMMLSSANEGCNMFAEAVSGSIDAFVEKMNAKAAALGCQDTHFVNTNGLPDSNHYTTAWDLYLITKEARKHPDFMPLVNTVHHEVPATNLHEARSLWSTNYLICGYRTSNYLYPGAEGIKTGSTSAAGYCLVSSASKSGRSVLSVVLGAEQVEKTGEDGKPYKVTESFSETARLFDWGFDNFSRQVIVTADELVCEVPVTLSQEQNTVKVHPDQEIERLLPKELEGRLEDEMERDITHVDSVEAPVTKGQVLGQMTLSYDGTVYATVNLLADEDVAASPLLVFRRDLIEFLHRPIVWAAAAAALALIVVIIVARVRANSRRRRYGGGGYRRPGYKGRRRK